MKIRFTAELVSDSGEVLKAPVSVETNVPDISEYAHPSEFYEVFDRFERPAIQARNQIASEIAKEYLDAVSFLKCGGNKPKCGNRS